MIRENNRLTSILRSMIRSRILTGLLCFSFFMLPISVAPKSSCHASGMEKANKNDFQMGASIDWNHSSIHRILFDNHCSCSSSVSSCCMGHINNSPKNPRISLPQTDTLRKLPVLLATVIKSSDHTPLSQQHAYVHDFNSFLQKESFLVNCAFLI
jgi:hypothetical protein